MSGPDHQRCRTSPAGSRIENREPNIENRHSPTQLIGRASELARIEGAIAGAGSGDLAAILLAGEAGVGKTRLVAEASGRARGLGCTILEGASFEFDRAVPLAPFVDLVRLLLLQSPPAIERRELEAVLGALGAPGPAEFSSPQDQKQRAFAAVCELVSRLASRAPVLVILEDLHWADDLSLELLLVLTRRLRTEPVLLVGTYRSDEVDPALAGTVAQLTHSRLGEVLELDPFGLAETRAFVEHLLGASSLRADVVQRLQVLTEGNAFFLEEVGKSLGPSGEALQVDSTVTSLPLGVVRPPESIREAVRRRAQGLSPAAMQVLSVAAVAGRRFDFEVVSAVAGIDEHALVPLLRQLVDAHLVVEEMPDRFSFRHALTQQAVLAGMLSRERRQLHLQVAEVLHGRGRPTDLPDMANHYFLAEAWEPAAAYARSVGDRAMAMYAPKAAAEQFDRATFALEAMGQEPGCDLLWARAQAYDSLGEFEPARAGYEAAAATAKRVGDRRREWQALVDLGLLWSSRDYRSARSHLEASLDLARALGDPPLLAQSLNRVGNFHVNALHPGDAIALHREALAIAERSGNKTAIAESYDLLGMASFQAADLAGADRYYEQAITSFRALDDRHGLSSALAVRAVCGGSNITDTEPPAARTPADQARDFEESRALSEATGWRPGEAFACAVEAWVSTAHGEYRRALAAGQRALAIAEEIDHRQWTVAACHALGRLYADVFAVDAALGYLERAFALSRELQSPLWVSNSGGSLASLLATIGEPGQAEGVLREVAPYVGNPGALHARTVRAAGVVLALKGGDPDRALTLVEALQAEVRGAEAVPLLCQLRGEALAALGRLDEAGAELDLAARQAEAQGLPPRVWRVQRELGLVARRQGARSRAATAFAAARSVATALAEELRGTEHLAPFEAGIERLLPPAGQPTPAQAAKLASAGLTARERDIAALVRDGLSNRAIATALTVSERTVEAHVSNILGKLGLTSRAQVAAWAAERGL